MSWTILHEFPSPAVEAAWRECLNQADFAAHYVSPEYFREPFFRDKKPFAVLAWQDEKIAGVLTGMHEGGQVICGQKSRPQCCFADSADMVSVAASLSEGLLAEAADARLITLFSWRPAAGFQSSGFRREDQEGVVVLDLTRGADALFKDFSSNRRTNVRSAIKRGVEVAPAETREDFKAYYAVYANWCARKQQPTVPFETFEQALLLRDNRRLFLARFEGKVVAGVIIRLYPKGMIEYAANSSFEENLKVKPNDLLHWRVIEWACSEGYTRYNLAGAHLFLRKMGGTIIPVYRYRFDRTWLHRHELKDALAKSGRKVFESLPERLQNQVRRALKGTD
jgi:Acetyltransferase (GNAT) domain